jgi:hypothetical protein
MPIYIKKIEGVILDTYLSDVSFISLINADIQFEDYVNLGSFIAFLQNFSKASEIVNIEKPLTFGLKRQFNEQTINLEISY